MRARILRPEEWGRVEPDLSGLLPYVAPQNVAVVVVEEDGEIVASVCAMQVTHFEGLWIKPDHRGNAGVFRALIRQAYEVPRSRGEKWALGGAANGDDRMGRLCTRLGGEWLPMALYALPLGED